MAVLGSLRVSTISLVGNLVLAGLAVGASVMALETSRELGSRLAYAQENTVPSLVKLQRISQRIDDARLAITKIMLASDDATREKFGKKLDDSSADVSRQLAAYRPSFPMPRNRRNMIAWCKAGASIRPRRWKSAIRPAPITRPRRPSSIAISMRWGRRFRIGGNRGDLQPGCQRKDRRRSQGRHRAGLPADRRHHPHRAAGLAGGDLAVLAPRHASAQPVDGRDAGNGARGWIYRAGR
jgi:hypothetical protein